MVVFINEYTLHKTTVHALLFFMMLTLIKRTVMSGDQLIIFIELFLIIILFFVSNSGDSEAVTADLSQGETEDFYLCYSS